MCRRIRAGIRKLSMSIYPKRLVINLILMITLVIPYPGTMIAKAESTKPDRSAMSATRQLITSAPGEIQAITSTVPVPSVSPGTEPTIAPTASPIPTASPAPTASPTPTVVLSRSKTLNRMANYDYLNNSVTGVSKAKATLTELQKRLYNIGTLKGNGMPYEEYKEAMGYMWTDETQYDKKTVRIQVDVSKTMDYNAYIEILKKLSRYEGVYLYKIGTSSQGRALYAVEIDIKSDYNKNIIMLTGQIHSREFGGGTFIVKQLVDLMQKAQTDKKTLELLKRNKYVAVPIINVDGREALIKTPGKYTNNGKTLWKAYPNGTDGGRNFPGLQWGQIVKGSSRKSVIATKPSYANYPGTNAGTMNETKALMKWLYHYIVVEKANIYIDMHNQGSIVYAGKTWQTKAQAKKSSNLRTGVLGILNKGTTKRKYKPVYEEAMYGLRGEGSSLTDYAITLAIGAKFSPAYGFSAFTDGKKEYILMQVKDLDQTKLKFAAPNPNFAAITLEIGYGGSFLGNASKARSLLANEYNYYNYGKLLEALPKIIK